MSEQAEDSPQDRSGHQHLRMKPRYPGGRRRGRRGLPRSAIVVEIFC